MSKNIYDVQKIEDIVVYNFSFLCKLNDFCKYFSLNPYFRKADLRELKLLQKVENRQYQDLVFKAQYMRDQQEKKFEQEMQVLENLFPLLSSWLHTFWTLEKVHV